MEGQFNARISRLERMKDSATEIPKPTAEDSGKILIVNNAGDYNLISKTAPILPMVNCLYDNAVSKILTSPSFNRCNCAAFYGAGYQQAQGRIRTPFIISSVYNDAVNYRVVALQDFSRYTQPLTINDSDKIALDTKLSIASYTQTIATVLSIQLSGNNIVTRRIYIEVLDGEDNVLDSFYSMQIVFTLTNNVVETEFLKDIRDGDSSLHITAIVLEKYRDNKLFTISETKLLVDSADNFGTSAYYSPELVAGDSASYYGVTQMLNKLNDNRVFIFKKEVQ